jgi:hypothetical protein
MEFIREIRCEIKERKRKEAVTVSHKFITNPKSRRRII